MAAAVVVIGAGVFSVVFLLQQQQASAFQYYACNSIIQTTCMHQDNRYSTAEPDKTPFILPFPWKYSSELSTRSLGEVCILKMTLLMSRSTRESWVIW